jgi:hypothetical protein
MSKNKKSLELLNMILTSTKSDEKVRHKWNTRQTYINENRDYISDKVDYYDITLNNKEMIYVYEIRISRLPRLFFDRYVTQITLKSATDRYASEKNMFFDSNTAFYTRSIQKRIFKLLLGREKESLLKNEDEKFDILIKDVQKSVNKVNLRDDKIDEVLK